MLRVQLQALLGHGVDCTQGPSLVTIASYTDNNPLGCNTFDELCEHGVTLFTPSLLAGVISGFVFCLLRVAEYMLCTYLVYHVYTLCIYTTICICSVSSALTKGRQPTTIVYAVSSSAVG